MTAPSSPPPSRFPTFAKIRAFFGWKFWRRCLLSLAVLATIVGLFYTEENIRGKRTWEKYRAEQEAKGVNFELKALVPPEVPNEQNFAMTPFLAPLYDFVPGTQQVRDTNTQARALNFAKDARIEIVGQSTWRKGERIDLAKWCAEFQNKSGGNASATDGLSRAQLAEKTIALLKEFDPVLDEIRTASQRPHARFNIQYGWENPAGILLPHLAVIKRLCQILALRASAELSVGRVDRAFDDLKLMLYLTDTMKAEPIVISQLVRIACFQIACQVLWEGLGEHQWSDAQLREITGRLQDINLLRDNLMAMDGGERAGMGHGIFEYVRKNPAMLGMLSSDTPETRRVHWEFMQLFPTGWFYFEEVNYNQLFSKYALPGTDANAKRVEPREIQNHGAELEKALKVHPIAAITQHTLMSALLLPALVSIHKRAALGQTSIDEAVVACALERYRLKNGALPESLENLSPEFLPKVPHDVIAGQPLKYQRTSDGLFLLYSVGWDEKDDGGKAVLFASKTIDLDKGDWVWGYSANVAK